MVDPKPICHSSYISAHAVSTRAVTGQTGKQGSHESEGSWSPGTRGASQGSLASWRGRVCTWNTLTWRAISCSATTKPAAGRKAHRNQNRLQDKRKRSLRRCFSSRSPANPGCRRPPVLTPKPNRGKTPRRCHASCHLLLKVEMRGCRHMLRSRPPLGRDRPH